MQPSHQSIQIRHAYYEDALAHNYDTEDPAGSRILENHLSVM